MNNAPFFTIGIPVYNAEKYLPLCLNSILNQSYKDFELILVNDGSTDRSLDICRSYQEQDSRIIVIDQKNGGVSAASNRVLDHASGIYIYLMDSDDEMYEGILQKTHDYLVAEEVDILHGGYYASSPGEDLKLRLFRYDSFQTGFSTLFEFLNYEASVRFSAALWTKFVRADFWKGSGVRFQSKYDGAQDWDVSRNLMRYAMKVHYIDEVIITWYHPREGSLSTAWSFTTAKNHCRLMSDILHEAMSELWGESKDQYEKMIIQGCGSRLWHITDYSKQQQCEIGEIIAPIRKCFKPQYASDRRTAFLFFIIRYFGCRNAAIVITMIRKLKHIVLRR
ncbi:MAG: glycosyltransferase [Clostridia bacterium]|nr:glycosyltransferase [Clostridia bacterium]